MAFSTITDGTNTFEFVSDQEYELNVALWDYKEGAYPDGEGWIGTGGHHKLVIKVSGSAISNKNTNNQGADYQIWDTLLKIFRNNGSPSTLDENPQTLTLVLNTGNLILTGWMTAFNAPRRAPEGIVEIPITIDFVIKTEDHSGLS